MTEQWLTPGELAAELGVTRGTIAAWRVAKPRRGPRAHRIGRHLRFARADVDAWIAAQAEPDADTGADPPLAAG